MESGRPEMAVEKWMEWWLGISFLSLIFMSSNGLRLLFNLLVLNSSICWTAFGAISKIKFNCVCQVIYLTFPVERERKICVSRRNCEVGPTNKNRRQVYVLSNFPMFFHLWHFIGENTINHNKQTFQCQNILLKKLVKSI